MDFILFACEFGGAVPQPHGADHENQCRDLLRLRTDGRSTMGFDLARAGQRAVLRGILSIRVRGLLANIQSLDQVQVFLRVNTLQIVEQPPAAAHHHQ